MKIACPTCSTRYQVRASLLGVEGRSVRCVRCQAVWHATPSASDIAVLQIGKGKSVADIGKALFSTAVGSVRTLPDQALHPGSSKSHVKIDWFCGVRR